MKAVFLAGGLGTRLSEETHLKPKPMIEIGGRPILWHIMNLYAYHGITEFIVCAGYKGYVIKEFFANYFVHTSDVTFDFGLKTMEVHEQRSEPWKVTVIDTGENTMTGGRLRRVRDYIGDETFCFTYGDGVGDVDITALLALHRREKRKATLTAVQPPGRYGALKIEENRVTQFQEKPVGDGAWINGGFFVLEPSVIDYIENDATAWEWHPLQDLSCDGELAVYRHNGFWRPMDTLRDKIQLEEMWNHGKAPWKVW